MNNLDDASLMTAFKLPVVIVIGDESVGKSSLLENITKCAVFPRAAGICTRCPVRLQLTHSPSAADTSVEVQFGSESWVLSSPDEILRRVEQVMSGLQADDVSETELIIKIKQCNIPTFEYIDLPGLRSIPLSMATRIRNLVSHYLSQPNTLTLCVVAATTPRITSSQALGLVAERGMQARTILALTKPDLVHDRDFNELILRRLDGSSDELNVNGVKLAHCVAVKNRVHDADLALADVDEQESDWWTTLLSSLPVAHARAVRPHTKLFNLVRVVDGLYHDFICKHWKPMALQQLAPMLKAAATDVEALGTEPQQLTAQAVLTRIREQLRTHWPKVSTAPPAGDVSMPSQLSGSLEWAQRHRQADESVRRWLPAYLRGPPLPFLQEILDALNATFDSALPLRLERFSELRAALTVVFDSEYVRLMGDQRVQNDIKKLVFSTELAPSYYLFHQGQRVPLASPARAKPWVDSYLLCHICVPMFEADFLIADEIVASLPMLKESETYALKRAKLTIRLTKLQHAHQTISDIEHALPAE